MSMERPCVLVGVTGCIAAYKACEIVRGLQKAGVRVKVVMTEHGTHFVDPVTFRALTHEKVAVGLFDDPSDPIHHISLAQECDVFLIAPCTANVMAKVACGIADDLLSTTALATTATLAIAPAANVHMYEAAATQANMATLRSRGVLFIEGDAGYLACGDVGRGRLADPAIVVRETLALLAERVGLDALRGACEQHGEIPFTAVLEQVNAAYETMAHAEGEGARAEAGDGSAAPAASAAPVEAAAAPAARSDAAIPVPESAPQPGAVADGAAAMPAGALAGRTVLVTAGPTVEPIDAVRYVSNYSSGKMGYALAADAAARGAAVTLISGPVSLPAPAGVTVMGVRTAREMLAAAEQACPAASVAVFAAAVADYRPAAPSDRKLKKGADEAALAAVELVPNPDILATIGAAKGPGQVIVGFAAETDDVAANARKKLASKHADMIVANQVGEGRAFGTDDNQATLVTAAGDEVLPLMPKPELAHLIWTRALALR